MQKLKLKLVFLLGVFMTLTLLLGISVYATDGNIQIIKESDTNYLIYVKNNLDKPFEFAFSNDETEPTTYLEAATDSAEGGNYIAYINSYTTANRYMWAKNDEGAYIVECVELDLSKAKRYSGSTFSLCRKTISLVDAI